MRFVMAEDRLPLLDSLIQLLEKEFAREQAVSVDKASKIVVLFFTVGDLFENQLRGLEICSDDLTKPFQAAEIKARIIDLLSKNGVIPANQLMNYRGIQLLGRDQDILVDGNPVKLTAKQYGVMEYLIQNKGAILSKEQIFDRIWGIDSETTIEIVEVYIHHLRKKLAPFGYHTEIHTVRGVGYILNEE